MASDAAADLEAWFADYQQPGSFDYQKKPAAFRVFEPARRPGRIVFATRQQPAFTAREQLPEHQRPGLIAPMYGLPCEADGAWIARSVGDAELVFLGDLDPVDLLILAWLRVRLDRDVAHVGINDGYLRALDVVLPKAAVPSLTPAEQQALQLLAKVLPDYRDLVGPKCAAVLDQGLKIEIDAIAGVLGSPAELLRPALGGF